MKTFLLNSSKTLRSPILSVFFFLTFINVNFILAQKHVHTSECGHLHDHEHQNGTCISTEDRSMLFELARISYSELERKGELQETNSRNSVSFIWPVKGTSQLNNASNWGRVYGVSNYVDHDPGNGILDYACKSTTYNGHKGTDIYTWPFGWYIMENNLVEVVAAEGGQIIHKEDGNNSYSCSLNGSNWNSVFIQHNDGTVAWYGHLKKNSLTHKAIGSYVSKGEYLGIVGSSGNSTGPHLHLEVYTSESYSHLIDPFQGSCNHLSSNGGLWTNQRSHREPRLNAIFTHDKLPKVGCHNVEEPNLKNDFTPGQRVYLSRFYSDNEFGLSSTMRVYRPNGTLYDSWTHSSTNSYNAAYNTNYIDMPAAGPFGQWKYTVTYQGTTLTHYFNYGGNTTCNKPHTPNVTQITHNSVSLDWNNVSGANKYEVYYWSSTGWKYLDDTYVSNYTVNGLQAKSTYYFAIRSICTYGKSDLSNYVAVVTKAKPACNAPNRPTVSNLTTNSLTLSWNSVSGADRYYLYYWNGSAWTYFHDTHSTSSGVTNLTPNTKYYFAVRSKCGASYSPLSSYVTVTTKKHYTCTAPNRPTVSGLTSTSLKLHWNTISGASYYNIYQWNGSKWVYLTYSSTNSKTIAGLSAKKTYYFAVSAVCASGESKLSPYKKVITPAQQGCATPNKPHVSNITSNSAYLSWNSISNANYYELFYWNGSSWISFATTYNTNYNVTNLSANSTYYIAVRTICHSGYSNLSTYVTIKTNSGYSCGKPTGLYAYNVQHNKCNLAWNTVSGADKYEVFYWTGTYWDHFFTTSYTSMTVTGLYANKTYYFSLRAVCGSKKSNLSDYITVKTPTYLSDDGNNEEMINGGDVEQLLITGEKINTSFENVEVQSQQVENRSSDVINATQNSFVGIFPSISQGGQQVRLTFEGVENQQSKVMITSINGSSISVSDLTMDSGTSDYQLETPFKPGLYLVTVVFEDGSKQTKRLVIQ